MKGATVSVRLGWPQNADAVEVGEIEVYAYLDSALLYTRFDDPYETDAGASLDVAQLRDLAAGLTLLADRLDGRVTLSGALEHPESGAVQRKGPCDER